MTVGIVIPAYNAASTLPSVLGRIDDACAGLDLHGIWIVNDGSADATGQVAAEAAAHDTRLTAIDLPANRGYGGAVKVGLRAARSAGLSVVACVHADGQYAPERLPALLETLRRRRLDVLQGSRIASGTALSGGMPLYKYLVGRALTAMENRVFDLRMSDYHSGYLVYGPRALQQIPFARLSDSFDFDLEVIASARAAGLSIGELPIPTHYGDEVSHLNPITYGLRVLRVMAGYLAGRYHPGHADGGIR